MLSFYFDNVLYKKIKMTLKAYGSGDKILNGLLAAPVIHQTCLKT